MRKKTDLSVVAYEQNYTHFRALNSIMWQIPVLAMTLTGGLWFGVSKIQTNFLLVSVLLLTAVIGNLALALVLIRFRHVMGCYLKWLESADKKSFVSVKCGVSEGWLAKKIGAKDKFVRDLFLFMLCWSAACSFLMFAVSTWSFVKETDMNLKTTIEYYDSHALALADGYESVSFEAAYPFLVEKLSKAPLDVLDIGSGTGRDAAWLDNKGHAVVAVEPSTSMRKLSERIHPDTDVVWLEAYLPSLNSPELEGRKFDLILMNAVWMHLSDKQATGSLKRTQGLLADGGSIIVSIRVGPQEPDRLMYETSPDKFVSQAKHEGFKVKIVGQFDDLLGRPEVYWIVYELTI